MNVASGQTAELSWHDIQDPANHVLLTRAEGESGFLLVSVLPQLDDQSEWVHNVDRIKIRMPIQ